MAIDTGGAGFPHYHTPVKSILVAFFVGMASTAFPDWVLPTPSLILIIYAAALYVVLPVLVLLALAGLFLMLYVKHAAVRRLRNRDSTPLEEEDPFYHALYRAQVRLGWVVFVGLGGALGITVGIAWIGWLIAWSGGIGH